MQIPWQQVQRRVQRSFEACLQHPHIISNICSLWQSCDLFQTNALNGKICMLRLPKYCCECSPARVLLHQQVKTMTEDLENKLKKTKSQNIQHPAETFNMTCFSVCFVWSYLIKLSRQDDQNQSINHKHQFTFSHQITETLQGQSSKVGDNHLRTDVD